MPPPAANVFISYARADGADEAERLYHALMAKGITAWRDTKNLDPSKDFSGEIDAAIDAASHVVVCVTPDIFRADSFVRKEIAAALEANKPVVPLVFPGGRRPITIINHTYIPFADWDKGFADLLGRLTRTGNDYITPQTVREYELRYLQEVGQRYDHWRDLYTDMAAQALIEQPKVRVKSGAAARHLDMEHDIYRSIDHSPDDDRSKAISVQSFDELREGIRKFRRVALIGDPGAGKTTTLQRLAYELATAAVEDEANPLPLFVRLGGYAGGDFDAYLEASFGGLSLRSYFPLRVTLLLDGLNEMPPDYAALIKAWLEKHTDTAVIVSCRKLNYVGLKLPLQRIDIAPLDVRRIRLFIGNYLEDEDRESLFWALSGKATTEAWAWYGKETKVTPAERFDAFWGGGDEPGSNWEPERRTLIANRKQRAERGALPGMLGVVSNPFLLYIVIRVFTRTGTPPQNRGQLFDQFAHLLMEQRGRPAALTRPPWIDETVQRRALARLAYQMQAEGGSTLVDEAFALKAMREACPEHDADHLLYLAASASLIERGTTVRFVHQLLQEYFAADEMREDVRRGVPASRYFANPRWWEANVWDETALFLAGMEGDSTAVVRWLAEVQPTLAYRCATESGAVCTPEAMQLLYEPPALRGLDGEALIAKARSLRLCPRARAEWGRKLDERGDTRPGVGLRADGLPDIAWCKVEKATPGETFIFQEKRIPSPETFWIAKYPITYRQFQAFLDDPDGYGEAKWWEGLHEKGHRQQQGGASEQYFKFWNHPRENVSWYDAMAFCAWLSAKFGVTVRLPTEQQWEKAARGTDGRIYPWGDEYIPGYANIDETEDGTGPTWLRHTTAVGQYPQGASTCGAMDMSGNVWEWSLNEYHSEKTNISSDATRLVRGGSWISSIVTARAANRLNYSPSNRNIDLGFRVAVFVCPLL